MRDARAIARNQQRLAKAVMRYRHVGFGQQRGRRDDQRHAGEDARLFGDVTRGIGIGGGIDMRDAGGLRRAMRDELARQFELTEGRSVHGH